MTRSQRLDICARARAEEERARRLALREADDRLAAAELEASAARARLEVESDGLADALSARPMHLGRVALCQAAVAALERRQAKAAAALPPLRAAAEQQRRGLDAARLDRRVVELAVDRARLEERAASDRAARVETDDLVSARAGRAAQEEAA